MKRKKRFPIIPTLGITLGLILLGSVHRAGLR